jgi:NADH dehydrogenase/NADH:ubiquinone oxidoreductase subunit G
VIVLDTEQSPLRRVAHVMLPVRHAAEKHGTYTSHGGRVQGVRPAVEPAWEAYSDGEVLARLGAALGLDGFDGRYDVRAVSRSLGEANTAFAGIHLDSVGDQGRLLADSVPASEATRS